MNHQRLENECAAFQRPWYTITWNIWKGEGATREEYWIIWGNTTSGSCRKLPYGFYKHSTHICNCKKCWDMQRMEIKKNKDSQLSWIHSNWDESICMFMSDDFITLLTKQALWPSAMCRSQISDRAAGHINLESMRVNCNIIQTMKIPTLTLCTSQKWIYNRRETWGKH